MKKFWPLKPRFVFFLFGQLILATLTLSGCGVKDDIIGINYSPMFVQSKIDGAESVNITVEAIDARIEKSNVGRKGDEYAILGKIIAQQNLIKTIEEAIVAEAVDDSDDEMELEIEGGRQSLSFDPNTKPAIQKKDALGGQT